jgi:predicted O-methyltransferase YrrM
MRLLARMSSPLPVYAAMARNRLSAPGFRQRFKPQQAAFEELLRQRDFTTNWFTMWLCEWLDILERHPLPQGAEVLEIGSWEGMSALFLLSARPDLRITCVDTWEGAETFVGTQQGADCERRFDANTAEHADRITKFRGTSAEYFASASGEGRFDLIYVDGSHYYADVLADAFAGFEALKPGGLMIFDDYMLGPYEDVDDRPGMAINRLLKEKRGQYELVAAYWQLALRKLPDA